MGSGWQALVRIAALEVLQTLPQSEQKPAFILFEEPETYLHPHLCRKLRNILGTLSKSGWPVVCSTHDPEFVNYSEPEQIARLWRKKSGNDHGHLLTDSLPNGPKLQDKLDERGSHEFLFANRVILCEGKDDRHSLLLFFKKLGVDIDGLGVSILDLGGVGSIPDYAEMAKVLKIPWCALTDQDLLADGNIKHHTKKARDKLQAAATEKDLVPIWPGSLEGCLKSQDVSPAWQLDNLSLLSLENLEQKFPDYHSTASAIASWVVSASN